MCYFQNKVWSSKASQPLQKLRSPTSQNKYKVYVTEASKKTDTRMDSTHQAHHANVQTWFDRVASLKYQQVAD